MSVRQHTDEAMKRCRWYCLRKRNLKSGPSPHRDPLFIPGELRSDACPVMVASEQTSAPGENSFVTLPRKEG